MIKHFKTDSVIIRKFNMRDVEQVYLNLLLPKNLKEIEGCKGENVQEKEINYISMEQTKLIVKSAINEYYTDEPVWAVEDKESKNLIGVIKVTNYSPKNKICNITWTMSYKYWDNKFMKEALMKTFKFLFAKKNLDLIECSYYEQNNKTNIILDEIGMTREATLRDRRVNEQTHKKEDFIIYSINKQEFFETINSKKIKHCHYKN